MLAPVELVARRDGDIFLTFSVHKSNTEANPSNFHGIIKNSQQGFITSDLFECNAAFSSKNNQLDAFFSVDAVFSLKLRSYACRFSPLPALFTLRASTFEDDVELEVKANPIVGNRMKITGDRAKFKFISGFYIFTQELELTATEPSDVIQITVRNVCLIHLKHTHLFQGLNVVLNSLKMTPSHLEYVTIGRPYTNVEG